MANVTALSIACESAGNHSGQLGAEAMFRVMPILGIGRISRLIGPRMIRVQVAVVLRQQRSMTASKRTGLPGRFLREPDGH